MKLIQKYFPELDEHTLGKFQQFQTDFLDWNDKINCISRKDTENFEQRHILHSLAIAKIIQFPDGANVLDVGTGGGFPGIPLAILFPNVSFHLIDGIGKKAKLAEEVVGSLGLKNVKVSKARSEEIKGQYDFITARAVARASSFHQWVKHLKDNKSKMDGHGIYYLKGGDVLEEMRELKRPYRIWDLSTYFDEEFFETKKVVFF